MLTEISVYLPNNPGVLAKFIKLLNNNDIRIKAINVVETPDYGLLLVLVDKPQLCINILKEYNYEISATEVLALKLPDDPNALFDIANILGKNKVNIEYLYNTLVKNAILMIVRVDNNNKAQEVLSNEGFTLVEVEEL